MGMLKVVPPCLDLHNTVASRQVTRPIARWRDGKQELVDWNRLGPDERLRVSGELSDDLLSL